MKEVLINESQRYGMAIIVLVCCVIGLCYAVKTMWDNNKDTQKKMIDVIKENTVAFHQLQSSINMLISLLAKK
jgi:uncharacterized protein (DUF2461 family)